ncbi:MAG: hypothetical protein DRO14_01400 [Thermoprotei archaeon]|nr:MAG: hypothetical protein DRO14_01400 [Thermoprotei archaeon]
MSEKNRGAVIKKMGELLRSGAVMLDQACPLCGTPLFKLKSGEIVCPVHGTVRVVRSESEAISVTTSAVLDELEKFIAQRIFQILSRIKTLEDIEVSDVDLLNRLLDSLERIRRIKKL